MGAVNFLPGELLAFQEDRLGLDIKRVWKVCLPCLFQPHFERKLGIRIQDLE